jgi:dTDP-4-amino-4,6-dideoxygalactose transaminase
VTLPIPQVVPGRLVDERREEIGAALDRVLGSGMFIQGEEGRSFEREFASEVGTADAVGVANGTDAIEIALRALGIGPGDGVLTVAHTSGATVTAIVRAGATPILVDVDDSSFTMDVASVEAAIAAPLDVPIRAIVPVHLYGAMADMKRLMSLADTHGLVVVEDCAQAHGASIDGRPAGSWGAAAAFSFYPTKNLAAVGDAGALVTSDPVIADAARQLREYGWQPRQVVVRDGLNSRLDEVHAAVLRVGLRHLAEDNRRRVAIAAAYDDGLAASNLVLPVPGRGLAHVFHQYVVRTSHREKLRQAWEADGVGTAIHYPVPIHKQPGLARHVRVAGTLAVTERLATEIVSLPMHQALRDDEVERVIATVGDPATAGAV